MTAENKMNLIDTAEALKIVAQYSRQITKPTLIKWVKYNDLGYQCLAGGSWYIHKDKLIQLMKGGRCENRKIGKAGKRVRP